MVEYDTLKESLTGGGKIKVWSVRKVLCVLAQFAPYFLMWYGFFLILNDIVASWCVVEFTGCYAADNVTRENITTNADMFNCNKLNAGEAVGVLIILMAVWAGLTMAAQFIVLMLKIGDAPFGSLALLVWLEVAKEKGSIFNTFTKVSALVIFGASVYTITEFFLSFEGNANDILNVTFQALTSLWTAYQLSTYDSPVTTVYHARLCPDVILEYSWWQPSEDVIANLHLILAINPKTAADLVREGDGDGKRLGDILTEKNLDHLDPDLLASMGRGEEGVAVLEIVRKYFSSPPTKEVVHRVQREEGTGVFGGLLQRAGGEEHQPILKEVAMDDMVPAAEEVVKKLKKELEDKDREIIRLQKLVEAAVKGNGPTTPRETPPSSEDGEGPKEPPPREVLVEIVKKAAMDLLSAVDFGPAVSHVLDTYTESSALFQLTSNLPALQHALLSAASPTPRRSERIMTPALPPASAPAPLAPGGSAAGSSAAR